MKANETPTVNPAAPWSRRELFSILPMAAGCVGCLAATRCAAQPGAPPPAPGWTEKADTTWENIFRFAYQRNFIPYMQGLAGQIGNEKFTNMLKDIASGLATTGMTQKSIPRRDLATWIGNMKAGDPLFQHALVYEVVEESAQAAEVRITRCLWAKTFREMNAADIGYAAICHPDYAAASGFNPKLKLIRTKTLMQGQDCCNHRWVMEA